MPAISFARVRNTTLQAAEPADRCKSDHELLAQKALAISFCKGATATTLQAYAEPADRCKSAQQALAISFCKGATATTLQAYDEPADNCKSAQQALAIRVARVPPPPLCRPTMSRPTTASLIMMHIQLQMPSRQVLGVHIPRFVHCMCRPTWSPVTTASLMSCPPMARQACASEVVVHTHCWLHGRIITRQDLADFLAIGNLNTLPRCRPTTSRPSTASPNCLARHALCS